MNTKAYIYKIPHTGALPWTVVQNGKAKRYQTWMEAIASTKDK